MAAVNYIAFLEKKKNQKMQEEKSVVPLISSVPLQVCDLNSTEKFYPSTAIEDSSDLMHPVPEDSITEELQLRSTPMDDQLSSGPTLSDVSPNEIALWLSMDSTECLDEDELPELNSLDEVVQWLGVDVPLCSSPCA
jgi:hypothetical protein